MIEVLHSLILGIIQGITEFLPISSSAHLKAFAIMFNLSEISESFDVALHIGTLLAICIFFFKDGIELISCGFKVVQSKLKKEYSISDEEKVHGNVFWYIILATIPAGILSLILDKISDNVIAGDKTIEVICIAIASIVMGILLYVIDKKMENRKSFDLLKLKDTIIIGTSQALAAAFPGVSRSGITITTARLLKYDRKSSAKLSFLLSIPIVLAAVLVSLKDFSLDNPVAFFVGIFTSFIVGLVVIKVLMKYLEKGNYKFFAIYRIIFGIALIAYSCYIISQMAA